MGRHSRVSGAQRVELWLRYKAGETVLGIASALGQRSTTPASRSGGCHTRRSIAAFSFRLAVPQKREAAWAAAL